MDFSGFLGNLEVKEALSVAFALRRFPHAVLFQGEKGCGKRTLAMLTAKALVCRNRERAPCGECPSCVRAAAGSHPDIRVIEGSGTTRSLTVDAVKELSSDAIRMPEEASCSVYVLIMGDKPVEAAQNKLLKLIEEPPPSAVFILVCRSAELLLPTIRSRVQTFTLKPPSAEAAARWLSENCGTDPEKAEELSELCGGNLGEMQEELSGGDSAKALAVARDIAAALVSSGSHGLLSASAPLLKDRKLFKRALERLGIIFRDALVLRFGGGAVLSSCPREAGAFRSVPESRLARLSELCEDYRAKADRNANMSLLVTEFCARLFAAVHNVHK